MAKKIYYNVFSWILVLGLIVVWQAALAGPSPLASEESPDKPFIVTSIKPLAIIVQSALGNQARVEYLQSAAQSAHDVSLPVSALKKLEQADLIVWIGNSFESRIAKSMALIAQDKLLTIQSLQLAQPNTASSESAHSLAADDHSHKHNHQGLNYDPHVWLNPENANQIARHIQRRLGVEQKAIISEEQIARLTAELAPWHERYFLVHHDALGHFTDAFHLQPGLSIRSVSGASQGAKSLYQLRKDATALRASCVFVEPQYADRDARAIAHELSLKLIEVDIQGIDQPLSAESYTQFMTTLTMRFKSCF
jgi:zinc transport system substrate-binding protein